MHRHQEALDDRDPKCDLDAPLLQPEADAPSAMIDHIGGTGLQPAGIGRHVARLPTGFVDPDATEPLDRAGSLRSGVAVAEEPVDRQARRR